MNSVNLAVRLSRSDAAFLRSHGFEMTDISDDSPLVQRLVTRGPWRMRPLTFDPRAGKATILVENAQIDEAFVLSFGLEKSESGHFYYLGLFLGALLLT